MTSAGDESFIFRRARPEDKAEVLLFTQDTFHATYGEGDYIEYVFDDWLADPEGLFIVAEERGTGRVAAIDKLSFLSSTEAWGEGLRVNPAFRGQGLASRLQRYWIEQAQGMGARTARFLTLIGNKPVHRMAYHDGFSRLVTTRYWKWVAGEDIEGEARKVYSLRPATPEEAPTLFHLWQRSAASEMGCLLHRGWSFSASSSEEWVELARQGQLFIPDDAPVHTAALPPPTVLVMSDGGPEDEPQWFIGAATALSEEWSPLMRGLLALANASGVQKIEVLLPDTLDIHAAMKGAGFTPCSDDGRLCLFELDLNTGVANDSSSSP